LRFEPAERPSMHVTTLCLGALAFDEATGYEIKKMFEDGPFGHFLEASYGSIYPALTKLTEEGLVQCRVETQSGRPDKKIYALTEKGWLEFRSRLQEPPAADRYRSEFLFVLTFAHLLPRDQVAGLVDEKLGELEAALNLIDCSDEPDSPGKRFVRDYGRHMYQSSIAFLEENRHWLENVDSHELSFPDQHGAERTLSPND